MTRLDVRQCRRAVSGLVLAVAAASVAGGQPEPPPLPCALFPADSVWNADVSALAVHPRSAAYVASIGADRAVHADFGAGLYQRQPIGIPYTVVPPSQKPARMRFRYTDESDAGPYPIPRRAPIEGGRSSTGDRHVLVVEAEACRLYELFDAHPAGGRRWRAGSGAVWDLRSNALRPTGWTSADAAGLPILPGLVRYDEVASGTIAHAIRFTAPRTQRAYVWPARHQAADDDDPDLPPMGLRVRLKATVDTSAFSPANRVIVTALQRYGMLLADNGSAWYLSGVPDPRWSNDELHELGRLTGADFEAVDASSLMVDPDSGAAN